MVDVGISMCNFGEYLMALVIDSEDDDLLIVEIPNTLRDMKRRTRSGLIEIGDITVDGKPFKCVYPSKVSDSVHISAIDKGGKTVYRGSIIILGVDKKNGKELLRGLTDEEIALLKQNIGLMRIAKKENDSAYNAYVLCNVAVVD